MLGRQNIKRIGSEQPCYNILIHLCTTLTETNFGANHRFRSVWIQKCCLKQSKTQWQRLNLDAVIIAEVTLLYKFIVIKILI